MRGSSRWEIAEGGGSAVESFAKSLQVSSILARVLWNRGYRKEADARFFLGCQLRDLKDPFLLPSMGPAVERALRAIQNQESIALYGDYDVDGVASVALMNRAFQGLGAREVRSFLPDRFEEGYGLTPAGIERCLAKGKPNLLVVLDCGTNSVAEVEGLQRQGVDVIILDHHEPSIPAKPLALVNYKLGRDLEQSGSIQDPGTEFCTAGLVFKFCHALLKMGRQKGLREAERLDLKAYLDLVALATVADIAPLTGENRILTRHGFRQMFKTRFPGLRALMSVSGIRQEPTSYDCGFKLGPRLNAAGRLESALASLKLLLSEDEAESQKLSEMLDGINRERQAEELRVLEEARRDAEAQLQDAETRVLLVARTGWHEGVVGIVASRIMREFHLPTFVVALSADGLGKGSGRSIEGFNLALAVEATRALLVRGGGHAMAAGVSLESSKLDLWRNALQVHARSEQGLDGERLCRKVRVDVEVFLSQLNFELVEELKALEPCGIGNPRPLFLARRLEVAGEPRKVGGDGKHLKLWLKQGNVSVDAIAFGRGGLPICKGDLLDVVFELEINEYQGRKRVQLNVREIASESFK